MFERYTEKARRVIFFARYEASQFGSPYIETEHLLLGLLREDKALANRFLRSHAAVESIRKQIEGAHHHPRKGFHVGGSAAQPRMQARAGLRRRRSRAAQPQAHRHRAPAARPAARREVFRRRDPARARAAPLHHPRRAGAFAIGESRLQPSQGKLAAGRIQPRPDAGGHGQHARSADRARLRTRARGPDSVPPHQEQPGADRRARRRQDRHRRRPGAAHRRGRRAVVPRRQAHPGARSFADRRRHQVPRPVRRAPEDHHEGADGESERHHLHRRAAHAGRRRFGRRLARRRQHPEAGAFARRDPVHRRDHARRIPQVDREGPLARAPLPGRQGSAAHRGATRSRSCSASRTATRSSTPSPTPTKPSRRRSTRRAATSRTASCPTRPST